MSWLKEREGVQGIIDLYVKIPDYAEVKHLDNTDFFHKVEKLKEEFRHIRSSCLQDDDACLSEATGRLLRLTANHSKEAHKTIPSTGRSGETRRSCRCTLKPHLFCRCTLKPHPLCRSTLRPLPPTRPASFPHKYSTRLSLDEGETSEAASWSGTSASPSRTSTPEPPRRKEFFPPRNVEKRLLLRKGCPRGRGNALENSSYTSPLLPYVSQSPFRQSTQQPQKRSEARRGERQKKLMAQVKPFSVAKVSLKRQEGEGLEKGVLVRKVEPRQSPYFKLTKTSKDQIFKAQPAPPRSRALYSALRLKEEQEYRDLKKHLRAEALLRMSSLPPAMAARNQGQSANRRANSFLRRKAALRLEKKERDTQRSQDDDAHSNHSHEHQQERHEGVGLKENLLPSSQNVASQPMRRCRSGGVFESTSNDNKASRLRLQSARAGNHFEKTTRMKEAEKIREEAEEHLRILRREKRRWRLRNFHSEVWRHACSYSAEQDISMRRELRMATSILEQDSFRRDMASMLTRVRSAPLLLQGLRERKVELPKKHHHELQSSRRVPGKRKQSLLGEAEDALEQTDSVMAVAEGSLTDSDNEGKASPWDSTNDDNGHSLPPHTPTTERRDTEEEADEIIAQADEIMAHGEEEEPPQAQPTPHSLSQ